MSSCVRFNDDQPSPVKRQPKKIDTEQLPRPPLSVSLSPVPASHPHFLHTDRDGKKEQEAGPFFESGLGARGVVCDDFLFEKKEKHQSSACFCVGL